MLSEAAKAASDSYMIMDVQITNQDLRDLAKHHVGVYECEREAQGHRIKAGEILTKYKTQVGHGNWLAWVEKNCPFSERTARNYLEAFRVASKSASLADLPENGKIGAVSSSLEDDSPSQDASDQHSPSHKGKKDRKRETGYKFIYYSEGSIHKRLTPEGLAILKKVYPGKDESGKFNKLSSPLLERLVLHCETGGNAARIKGIRDSGYNPRCVFPKLIPVVAAEIIRRKLIDDIALQDELNAITDAHQQSQRLRVILLERKGIKPPVPQTAESDKPNHFPLTPRDWIDECCGTDDVGKEIRVIYNLVSEELPAVAVGITQRTTWWLKQDVGFRRRILQTLAKAFYRIKDCERAYNTFHELERRQPS